MIYSGNPINKFKPTPNSHRLQFLLLLLLAFLVQISRCQIPGSNPNEELPPIEPSNSTSGLFPIYVFDYYPYYQCEVGETFNSEELEEFTRFAIIKEIIDTSGLVEGEDYEFICFSDYEPGTEKFPIQEPFMVVDDWVTEVVVYKMIQTTQFGMDSFIVVAFQKKNYWEELTVMSGWLWLMILLIPVVCGVIVGLQNDDIDFEHYIFHFASCYFLAPELQTNQSMITKVKLTKFCKELFLC